MNSNENNFNYKVFNLIKHYNFGIRCASIRDCLKISKINLKTINIKCIFKTLKDLNKILIYNKLVDWVRPINNVNIQGGFIILNFEFQNLKT